MKRLLTIITGVSVVVLPYANPLFADQIAGGMETKKDECLLLAKNCATESIQERIERITQEIKMGSGIYSPDELKRLARQLDEYNKLLENMNTRGGNSL